MTLTSDEIMAMDADQLRLAIAKETGFIKDGHYWRITNDTFKRLVYLPDWPRDIAAAWGLVEELRTAFFSTHLIGWDHQDKYYVICHPRQGHGENLPDLEGQGATVPLAICRAWLIWKGSQK
jgi:hypothetical protein